MANDLHQAAEAVDLLTNNGYQVRKDARVYEEDNSVQDSEMVADLTVVLPTEDEDDSEDADD